MTLRVALITVVVDNREGGDAAVSEDGQRGDERRVRVDVGNVGVCPDAELLQRLFHEGRHGHLTHLTHEHGHTNTQGGHVKQSAHGQKRTSTSYSFPSQKPPHSFSSCVHYGLMTFSFICNMLE